VLVNHSAAFSAVLLDEIKNRLGDHDFTAIGRLMAVRREAWNVVNTRLAHCDREVASAARRIGWSVAYVPEAKVYYHVPASFSELQSDWNRTRRALARSSHTFDEIPWSVQLFAAWAAWRAAPFDGLCWLSCRTRLIITSRSRTAKTSFNPPYQWR
jgi:GT2 family glycosyltransferase